MSARPRKTGSHEPEGEMAPQEPAVEPGVVVQPEGDTAKTGEPAAEDALKALQERMLRLQADFDNFRKRTLRERNEMYRRANEDLMNEMLPVLDHFEMGLKTAKEHGTPDDVITGLRMVYEQLNGGLGRFGLAPVDAEGRPFDPNEHECIALMPSADVPHDVVVTQTRRGYRLGDLLLRPAQVVVSSGPAAAPASGGASEESGNGGEADQAEG